MWQFRYWLVALVLFAGFGCNGKSETPEEASKSAQKKGEDELPPELRKVYSRPDDGQGKKTVPLREKVKTFEGNWAVVISSQRQDLYLWLLKFSKGEDGKITAELIDSSNDRSEPKVASTEIDGQNVKLVVKNSVGEVDVQGRLTDEGIVWGTFQPSPVEILPMRLLPTTADSLKEYASATPGLAAEVFENAAKAPQEQLAGALVTTADNLNWSPLAIDAFATVLSNAAQFNLTPEQWKIVVDGYLKAAAVWGEPMVDFTKLNIGMQMVMQRRDPAQALKYLDEAEAHLTPARKEFWQPQLTAIRSAAKTEQELRGLRGTDVEEQKKAFAALQELLPAQPYNPEVLLALAEYAQKTEQDDLAIGYLEDLVALPLLEQFILQSRSQKGQPAGEPTPSDMLNALWKKKHGSEDGLKQRIAEVYAQRMAKINEEAIAAAGPVPDPATDQRTVLVEVITGTFCPPCIAAKIASSSLQKQFPTNRAIVLNYHQHIPGPNPFCNPDSEARAGYYEAQGAPMVYVDGRPLDSVRGMLQHGTPSYRALRGAVDQLLKLPTEGQLTLTATQKEGQIAVNAAVTNIPEDKLSGLRLRVAVVEDSIEMLAPNGIRHHNMVVRELLGGPKGTAARRGELKYEHTISTEELRKHIKDYLETFQSGNRVDFPETPMALEKLSVVAWVQDDRTREVLLSKLVSLSDVAANQTPAESAPATPMTEEKPADAATPANAAQ